VENLVELALEVDVTISFPNSQERRSWAGHWMVWQSIRLYRSYISYNFHLQPTGTWVLDWKEAEEDGQYKNILLAHKAGVLT